MDSDTRESLSKRGLLRVIITTCIACSGGLVWGYNTGVVSGVLSMETFHSHFNTSQKSSALLANSVSLLQAGGFFGALLISYVCQNLGRRKPMIVAGVVFLVGSGMELAGTGGIPLFYGGRVVSGLGIGGLTMVVPTYVTEVAPKRIRGFLMGLWQFWIVTGATIAYWVDYAVELHVSSSVQWQIPLAIQMVPAIMLIMGALILKESPRWLSKQGQHSQALLNLAHMRGLSPGAFSVQVEYREIYESILHEQEISGGATYKELLLPGNRKRVLLGFFVMMAQQFSGTNAIGYYAPQIFKAVGVRTISNGLFATGIYGIVKMVMTMLLCVFAVERIGRRRCLTGGAFFMGSCLVVIGCLLKIYPPQPSEEVSTATYAMMVCIYLYLSFFCFSWGPVPWIYSSEIYPNRLREYCVAMCAASQWLWNFVVTQFSPFAMRSTPWGTFILFAGFNFINMMFAAFLPETTNVSLEEMDAVFGVVNDYQDRTSRQLYDLEKELTLTEESSSPGRQTSLPVCPTCQTFV
jgi:sugar porter (SP) family MFS transporter